ncbi:MAG TPA: hypothetical protein VIV40_16605 [Kofleriaceae bacterium]
MRRAVVVTSVICALASPAAADPLPPGSLGFVFGVLSGTGADAKRLGFGFYQFGMQAAWQPTVTERPWGWSLRWSTMFGTLYNGTAAQIDTQLHTMQMDLQVGVRVRPWATPSRYLTARIGGELLRANEPIPPMEQRAFVGGIASVGLDQYVAGFMFNVDVRYGLIGSEAPRELALLVGVGVTGP